MIVAFLGTKGGTGTTTMAVNCAADVRRLSGRPTLIVDVKAGPGDVAVFLDVRPRYSLMELIDQVGWSEGHQVRRFVAEHHTGIHLLAASEEFGRPASRDAEGVEQALRAMAAVYDFVVIDAGSTLTSAAVAALTLADVVMLVANPDVPCLRNLQRLSDALRLAGVAPERLRIVLNRTSDSAVLAPAQIEQVLGRSIDYQLVSDYRTVAAAINSGVPISTMRATELHPQLEAMAKTIVADNVMAAAS